MSSTAVASVLLVGSLGSNGQPVAVTSNAGVLCASPRKFTKPPGSHETTTTLPFPSQPYVAWLPGGGTTQVGAVVVAVVAVVVAPLLTHVSVTTCDDAATETTITPTSP